VMDTGVAGVVAMRYVLYVETAKHFVADLYAALAQGQSLGEAVTFGRKQLAANPQREIAYKPIALQDWCVPIVYESAAIELFPKSGDHAGSPLRITTETDAQMRATQLGLPPRPDVGFFGRDETLLALDRAFDTQPIVLLHAFAGSGKTTTAAEFARWYALTGGVAGAIFFTSFERRKTLVEALTETIGRAFTDALEQAGVHWLALTDEQRRAVALQALQQIPVLWIWDNVEPIAGFPAGTPSAWSAAEQQELVAFLRDARETKAKFLLTSRRDERGWLGDLPRRIIVPPMPMQERVQLARALAEKFGHRITEVEDWRPLLQFTQGNPLTITVLVGQALRDGLRTRDQIVAFVERLRKGETAFADEESEARSKSLGASLSYGFASAFTEAERKQLALLHFFQGFVDVDALRLMGNPKADYCLPEVRGMTREAGIALLDRAAEIGLLTAHRGGYYSIHPALPWYFKSLFDAYYATADPSTSLRAGSRPPTVPSSGQPLAVSGRREATRAFVEAMGSLGNYYHDQYEDGNRDVISALTAEEANLLHARQIARVNGYWRVVISTMQGLRQLYEHTGRRAEWARLVNEIVPDFVDPAIDGPLAGREEEWRLIIEYRARLAMEARQWPEAERLQRVCVELDRKDAAPALAVPPEKLDGAQKNAIRTLATSLNQLARVQRDQDNQECITNFETAISLFASIEDRTASGHNAMNLGNAYLTVLRMRDLGKAESQFHRAFELYEPNDIKARGAALGQLRCVSYERFKEARAAKQSEQELLRHLNDAARFYLQMLELLPPNAVGDLAVAHGSLGNIYNDAGDLHRALSRWRESIRYFESEGNLHSAAQARRNVAVALARAGRLADAREYALAALRNYETFGDRAAKEIEETKGLIEAIKKAEGGKQ